MGAGVGLVAAPSLRSIIPLGHRSPIVMRSSTNAARTVTIATRGTLSARRSQQFAQPPHPTAGTQLRCAPRDAQLRANLVEAEAPHVMRHDSLPLARGHLAQGPVEVSGRRV